MRAGKAFPALNVFFILLYTPLCRLEVGLIIMFPSKMKGGPGMSIGAGDEGFKKSVSSLRGYS